MVIFFMYALGLWNFVFWRVSFLKASRASFSRYENFGNFRAENRCAFRIVFVSVYLGLFFICLYLFLSVSAICGTACACLCPCIYLYLSLSISGSKFVRLGVVRIVFIEINKTISYWIFLFLYTPLEFRTLARFIL